MKPSTGPFWVGASVPLRGYTLMMQSSWWVGHVALHPKASALGCRGQGGHKWKNHSTRVQQEAQDYCHTPWKHLNQKAGEQRKWHLRFKLQSWGLLPVSQTKRKRKNVLDRGKFMCLKPWQGGEKNQGTGHKESVGQDGSTPSECTRDR